MTYPATPSNYQNLPACQRFTQWLVDRFNDAESQWQVKYGPLAALRRRIRKREVKARRKSS